MHSELCIPFIGVGNDEPIGRARGLVVGVGGESILFYFILFCALPINNLLSPEIRLTPALENSNQVIYLSGEGETIQ